MNSKSLQDHNAQLAQKAKQIEELEELQAVQNRNVDGLMDIIQGLEGGDNIDGTGLGVELDGFMNWDSTIQDFTTGVDGQQISDVPDMEDFFSSNFPDSEIGRAHV